MAILSGNALKIIAAVCMVCDHAGLMLFPQVPALRLLGRLAYPVFAYMIAEGCKYTKNRRRYFLTVFALAVACQVVYFLFDGSMYLSILFTFSLSIVTVFALDALKRRPGIMTGVAFAGTVAAVYLLNRVFTIDYGFWGCMVPVFVSLPVGTKYDRLPVRALMLGLGLIPLAMDFGGSQYLSLLAVPLLLFYSGKRGKWKMKYFFYIFYPAHLVILQGIAMLMWA